MKYLIIQGSSRSNGNSKMISDLLASQLSARIIDLKEIQLEPYDYHHQYSSDRFLQLMREIVMADCLIFVTPVYWYSMSGIMKNFFDRITDCLKIDKETGRKLRGMKMASVACGSERTSVPGFFEPFRRSADYLGMTYLGDLHTWITDTAPDQEVVDLVEGFTESIMNSK